MFVTDLGISEIKLCERSRCFKRAKQSDSGKISMRLSGKNESNLEGIGRQTSQVKILEALEEHDLIRNHSDLVVIQNDCCQVLRLLDVGELTEQVL
jgi:hypothetical protein